MSAKAITPVHFHYQTKSFQFAERKRLKAFLSNLFLKEKQKLEDLSIVFCTDEYLLKINKAHLNHDYFTDIITFQFSAPNDPIKSEIYISKDRVQKNAVEYGVSFNHELHRVIFHGCLHLCGYSDKNKQAKLVMRLREDFYLNRYFVSRGTRQV
jgi:probable rRNA maturation factor